MKQKEIRYKDIIDLGFKVIKGKDSVYFDDYGYPYKIFEYPLGDKICIDWDQTTRKCNIVRYTDDYDIIKTEPIKDYQELKRIIRFFKD